MESNAMRKDARGLTLIELLATLSVLAILMGIGTPLLGSLVERVRITNAYHLLTASLMTARTAAITRRHPVTVCPSRDGHRCRDDQVWEQGWIVFDDPVRDGQPAGPASILRRVDALGANLILRSTSGRQRVRYGRSGRAYGSNVTLSLCLQDVSKLVGTVIVNNAGRARSSRAGARVRCPY